MKVLNDTLVLSDEARKTFRGGHAHRELLGAGHELYKFTAFSLYKPDGGVTDFWSSVTPIAPGDPGLKESFRRASQTNADPAVFTRARAAVTRQWNPMTGLLRAKLKVPVYAFVGQCAAQRMSKHPDPKLGDPKDKNVFFIGGGWQLWIPNLSNQFVEPDPKG